MDVGLDRGQQLRLEEEPLQLQPLERVALDHLHHRSREEPADVPQPAGDAGRRRPEATLAPGVAVSAVAGATPSSRRAERARRAVVDGTEGGIEASVVSLQGYGRGAAGPTAAAA